MARPNLDLSTAITEDGPREPIDHQVKLRRLYFTGDADLREVPHYAVVRSDTEEPISVVPDSCPLWLHQPVMETVLTAAEGLDLGPMPHGVHLDRGGARMRAVVTFPALAEPVQGTDRACPCIMVENAYDRVGRIILAAGALHCGARSLAVGGGGIFAEGFIRFGSGDAPAEDLERHLSYTLQAFPAIVRAYRIWAGRPMDLEGIDCVLEGLPSAIKVAIWRRIGEEREPTVFDAYKAAICHATRQMPTVHAAFRLLKYVNAGFQRVFRSR